MCFGPEEMYCTARSPAGPRRECTQSGKNCFICANPVPDTHTAVKCPSPHCPAVKHEYCCGKKYCSKECRIAPIEIDGADPVVTMCSVVIKRVHDDGAHSHNRDEYERIGGSIGGLNVASVDLVQNVTQSREAHYRTFLTDVAANNNIVHSSPSRGHMTNGHSSTQIPQIPDMIANGTASAYGTFDISDVPQPALEKKTADGSMNLMEQMFEKYAWFVGDLNNKIDRQYEAMKTLGDRIEQMCNIVDARVIPETSPISSNQSTLHSDGSVAGDDLQAESDSIFDRIIQRCGALSRGNRTSAAPNVQDLTALDEIFEYPSLQLDPILTPIIPNTVVVPTCDGDSRDDLVMQNIRLRLQLLRCKCVQHDSPAHIDCHSMFRR